MWFLYPEWNLADTRIYHFTSPPPMYESSGASRISYFGVLSTNSNIWMICVSASIVYFFSCLSVIISWPFTWLVIFYYMQTLYVRGIENPDDIICYTECSFFPLLSRWPWRMIVSVRWRIKLNRGWISVFAKQFISVYPYSSHVGLGWEPCKYLCPQPWRTVETQLCPSGVPNPTV